MNTTPSPSHSPSGRTPSWIRRRPVQIGIIVVAISLLSWGGVKGYQYATRNPNEGIAFFEVKSGPLTIDVSLAGAIQNRDQVIVKNQVEGRTTILWVVTEGNHVQKGDKLVELDSSQMEDQCKQQEITVSSCHAAFVAATQNRAITESQTQSDISKAQLDLLFAQMDANKYQEGDYKQSLDQAQADITVADQQLQQATNQAVWSRQLKEEGYLTAAQLQADELALTKSGLDANMAKVRLWLLQEYTHKRNLEQYRSNLEQAEMALDRVRRKAEADIVQSDASLTAKASEANRQVERLDKIRDQIAKCTIVAPVAGMVVYSTTGKPHWGGGDQPFQEGTQVIERQELIYLPTTSSMMAEVKVPESSLRKIKKDLRARITVDAVPGTTFRGRVGKIGLLPDAQNRWLNPDLKVYNTQILLEEEGVDLRVGMGCRVEIIVEDYPDAVYVPVQAVVRVGDRYLAYVLTPRGPEPREVTVGLDNNRMIHIKGGLTAGEKVMQTPPLSGSSKPAGENGNGTSTSRPASLTPPASQPDASPEPAAIDRREFLRLSPEDQKKVLEKLTPQQRQELMRRRPPRDGNAPPREGRPPGP